MVIVNINVEDPNDKGKELTYYMDGKLKEGLDKAKNNVNLKDSDKVYIVDGPEGAGKSVYAGQLGKYLDPTLDLSRICMTPQEFIKAVSNATKGQCIIYDEAFTGLSSRTSLSEINNLIVSMMMEMRQKNLFVIIVMPTFFLLDKYVALFRAKGLFHVYMKKGKRGFWVFFNNQKKKMLYLKGKKEYSYSYVKSHLKGRFLDKYIVNEKEYRDKKMLALKSKEKRLKNERYIEQRDKLVYILYKECGYSLYEIENLCKEYKIELKKSMINEILAKIKQLLDKYE